MNDVKPVSIIIPCCNEEKFISRCLDSIIAQDYPKDRLEVLVVDGMSKDGTRAIVNGYIQRHPFIRLLDNPKKITPAAMNIGVKNSNGAIIIRMDAHSEYFSNYIFETIRALEETKADNVGGIRITKPNGNTLIAELISILTSSAFGVGLAKYRFSDSGTFVDTVPNGAFKKDLFDKIGYFNENLLRNQDNEFNTRIIQNGGKIFLSPSIKSYYFNQATLKGLLLQAVRAGMWNVLTIRINPAAFRLRHFAPFIFVTALLILGFLAPFNTGAQFAFLALLGLYFSVAGGSALQIALRNRLIYFGILPGFFFLYHVCYGVGTWVGLLKMLITGWRCELINDKSAQEKL